jgi:O-antigen ligase
MRLNYYEQAFSQFCEQPIVGQGALSFRSLSDSGSVYPHNFFLDALGDLGLVGFFLSIFLVSFGLQACWYIIIAGDRAMYKIGAVLFMYCFGMEMSSGYLYWSWVWPWAIVVIQAQSQIRNSRSLQGVLSQDGSCTC